jgi:hypothetical protein
MRDYQTVVVRLSQGDPLGKTMSRLRTWLDTAKIQPAAFKTEAGAKGHTFTVGFTSIDQADRFRGQFGAAC